MKAPFAVIAALVLAACAGGSAQELNEVARRTPIAVRTAPVVDTIIGRPIAATGTVAPKDEIALSFKIGGVIASITVDPGDAVRAGATIAALDPREIDAAVTRARSGSEKAERDLARARRLYADSVVTLAQMQDAETAAEIARAELDAAQFNRQHAVIVAPASGTILRRAAEPGETVTSGTTILVLGSSARGNVIEVGLADRDAVTVRRNDPATVEFDAFPGRTFDGTVTEIAAAAAAATGAYPVEITVADAGVLVAGLVGRVAITPRRGVAATVIPIEALLEADDQTATVYALAPGGNHVERRRVKVAFIAGNRAAIVGGLEGIASVITDGAAYLSDGGAVRVTP